MRWRTAIASAALTAVLVTAARAGEGDVLERLQLTFQEVAARAARSVVRVAPVRTPQSRTLTSTPIGTMGITREPPAAGVAVAEEWVLTRRPRPNRRDVQIATPDGRVLRGRVEAQTDDPPIALVRVPGARLEPLPVGSSRHPCIGSWVLLLGNAFATGATGSPPVNLGLLSGRIQPKDRPPSLVVSAAANPGDAGGALVDTCGRLIGIVTDRRSTGDLTQVAPIEDVLERLGEVEGFAPRRAEKGEGDRPSDALSRHFCRLADSLHPSVVSLLVKRTAAAERTRSSPVRAGRQFFQRFKVSDRAVTGFLVDGRGTIVTAYANVADAKSRLELDGGESLLESVKAVLADGRVVPATLIGAHEGKGIAVFRIVAEGLVPAPIGAGRELGVGRWILTMGNPFGEDRSEAPLVGFGIVAESTFDRERYDALLTDAPINEANVGGPVVDMSGRVIGVSVTIVSPENAALRFGRNSGIGIVVPIEDVLALLPRLEKDGIVKFRPGYLGVRLEMEPVEDGGVRISQVVPDTGAARGGLKAGDIIQAVQGTEIRDGIVLRQILFALGPGAKIPLTVRRGDNVLTLEVTLTRRPDDLR